MTHHASQPLTLGRNGRPPRTLRNRLVSSPMERNYGTTDGRMTAQYADYLVTRARAGLAIVTTEATYVRADGKGRTHQLGLHTDAVVPGFRELTDAVHAAGALAAVEINHGGRTAQSAVSGLPPVAPAAVPCEVAGGEMPRALTTQECHELVDAYALAARRAVAAGFDAISIHGGHGYLVHQFMSARTNGRSDEFGAPEHFANLVIRAVRAAAPEALVGIRLSVLEGVADGLDAEQTLEVVARLDLEALDFLDLSAGSYEAGEWIVQSGEWRPGVLAEYARAYRRFGLPLGLAGRLNSPEAIETALADGVCDFVSLGRAVHADQAFVRGVLDGSPYRPCIACNVCIDNLGLGQVTCTVNPAVGRSRVPVPTPALRRDDDASRPGAVVRAAPAPHALVLGAGPAGLTAARELAGAGARVTLVEAGERIGGQFALAAGMRPTPDFHRYLDWNRAELARLGVEVRLGCPVDAGDLRGPVREFGADGIVLATGGGRPEPDFRVTGAGGQAGDGVEAGDGVLDVRDWLAARPGLLAGSSGPDGSDLPEAVTIWGADSVAMSVADTLAARGTRVLLIGPERAIAPESGRRAKILAVPRLEASPQVRIVLDARLVEAQAPGTPAARIRVVGPDGERWLDAPGPLLVSRGVVPLSSAVDREGREAALGLGAGAPVVLAGTVVDQLPPTASNAIKSGYDAAQRLAAALSPEPGHAPVSPASSPRILEGATA
ncbi:2,4-dienoyl-CoA reductase-like NADH-dependent reductase (Old Yellow Enzyme family) [Sinomonas atrocyanea]|uniref:oxidoreductase n=1 Tax=Sinomonas atrocyanea TaxID=37927 RepID=UPI00278ADBD7|nr:FAD-dependent oxidoreductase [Sinomonas atrocyanea]MDP9884498.1 2,4-dienoyl-CoA reductase-like NADH-dependent reductase (Old Yellow Enzyme family) [Sinomonas atrocyanea]